MTEENACAYGMAAVTRQGKGAASSPAATAACMLACCLPATCLLPAALIRLRPGPDPASPSPTGGYTVPANQDVMISVYNIHRSPAGKPPAVPAGPLARRPAPRRSCQVGATLLPPHHPAAAGFPLLQGSASGLANRCTCLRKLGPGAAARPPAVWEDPDEFIPERFPLDGPVPNEQNTDYKYIPFRWAP